MTIQTGTHAAQAEREARGWQWLRTGLPTVLSPGRRDAVAGQEMPWHPPSQIFAGVPPVAPPSAPVPPAILAQAEPDRPVSSLRAGPQGPNVAPPPQIASAILAQVDPDRPVSLLRAGPQGPNVAAPPQIASAIVVQTDPDRPLVRVFAGVEGPNVAALPQIASAIVAQADPDRPLARVFAGVQGPNVRSPAGIVITAQLLPGETPVVLFVSGAVAASRPTPPAFASAFALQETPREAFAWLGLPSAAGLPPPPAHAQDTLFLANLGRLMGRHGG